MPELLTGAQILCRALLESRAWTPSSGIPAARSCPCTTPCRSFRGCATCWCGTNRLRRTPPTATPVPPAGRGSVSRPPARARPISSPGWPPRHMDSSPVVAITGQVPRAMMGRDAFQETDIIGITLPITKHSVAGPGHHRAGRPGARGLCHRHRGAAGAGADRRAEGCAEPEDGVGRGRRAGRGAARPQAGELPAVARRCSRPPG